MKFEMIENNVIENASDEQHAADIEPCIIITSWDGGDTWYHDYDDVIITESKADFV
ncbi:MAG: hypothetical protein QNK37_22210 [Acidobacteriota bacterium]|nr:hypothetical protein [Acidobacteriota bacterium]